MSICAPCSPQSIPCPPAPPKDCCAPAECFISWTVGPRTNQSNPTVKLIINGAPANANVPIKVTPPYPAPEYIVLVTVDASGSAEIFLPLNSGDGIYLFTPQFSQCKFSPTCDKVFVGVPYSAGCQGVVIQRPPQTPKLTIIKCLCDNDLLVNWKYAGDTGRYKIRITYANGDPADEWVIPQDIGAQLFEDLDHSIGTIQIIDTVDNTIIESHAFDCCNCSNNPSVGAQNQHCNGALLVLPQFTGPATVNHGQSVTLVLVVQNTNTHPVVTGNIVVPLPPCLGGGSATIPAGLTIPPNSTQQFTYTVTASNPNAGTTTCQVVVAASMGTYTCQGQTYAISGGNAQITIQGQQQVCSLFVSISAQPSNIPNGGQTTLTITVTNNGNTTITGINCPPVSLPSGLVGGPVQFNLASLAPSASQTFTFLLTGVNNTSSPITNVITIPAGHITGSCGGNNVSNTSISTSVVVNGVAVGVSPVVVGVSPIVGDGVSPVSVGSADPFWCVSGNCVQSSSPPSGHTGGPYTTLAQCQSTCQAVPFWCYNNQCVQSVTSPGAGATGPYSTLAQCQQNCTLQGAGYWCAPSLGQGCQYHPSDPNVPPGSGYPWFGPYPTLSDCTNSPNCQSVSGDVGGDGYGPVADSNVVGDGL